MAILLLAELVVLLIPLNFKAFGEQGLAVHVATAALGTLGSSMLVLATYFIAGNLGYETQGLVLIASGAGVALTVLARLVINLFASKLKKYIAPLI